MSNTHTTEKQGSNSSFKMGNILYSTWGYEQTNVNFYQITKKVGLTMVELREIHIPHWVSNHIGNWLSEMCCYGQKV